MNPQTPISRTEIDTAFSIDPQEQIRLRAFEIYEQRGRADTVRLRNTHCYIQPEAKLEESDPSFCLLLVPADMSFGMM